MHPDNPKLSTYQILYEVNHTIEFNMLDKTSPEIHYPKVFVLWKIILVEKNQITFQNKWIKVNLPHNRIFIILPFLLSFGKFMFTSKVGPLLLLVLRIILSLLGNFPTQTCVVPSPNATFRFFGITHWLNIWWAWERDDDKFLVSLSYL